jgi:hypothetical protein
MDKTAQYLHAYVSKLRRPSFSRSRRGIFEYEHEYCSRGARLRKTTEIRESKLEETRTAQLQNVEAKPLYLTPSSRTRHLEPVISNPSSRERSIPNSMRCTASRKRHMPGGSHLAGPQSGAAPERSGTRAGSEGQHGPRGAGHNRPW